MQENFIIFLGSSEADKGSSSLICMKQLNWTQLSMDNLSQIGDEIDFTLKSGKLISDKLIASLVNDWLFSELYKNQSLILDEFSRMLDKAENFLKFVNIFDVDINDNIIRLLSRRTFQELQCQVVYSLNKNTGLSWIDKLIYDELVNILTKHDDEEVIKQRLIMYSKHGDILVNFYNKLEYLVHNLDGEVSLEHIYDQLIEH